MSEVTSIDKHQDNHTNTSNNTSDIIAPKPSLTDDKNRSKLDAVTEEVKQDLRGLFGKTGKLIRKLGNAMRKVVKEESICEEIKIALKEEIAEGVISRRTIERYCPDKWKKKTKPKNDKLSFSKQAEEKPQQQIVVTLEGKSVIVNETSGDTEAYPIPSEGVNEPHQSKQNGIDTNGNNEERTVDADTKEELAAMHSLKRNEDMTDGKKEMFVSHVPMSFAGLRKDMDTVSQITKGVGNIFFKVSVDLGTHEVKIEFCGITQQKNATMTSIGKGVLKEAN